MAYWGQVQTARDDFELKAAEIVTGTISPNGAANKAYSLKTIFTERLSTNFANAFALNNLTVNAHVTINKSNLLSLLADKSNDTITIVEYAKALFPEDPAIKDIDIKIIPANKANSADVKGRAAD